MASIAPTLSTSITNMVRLDHTKVMSVFHRYKASTSPGTKAAIVKTVCLDLDIHAQLEEEILYPAMAALDPDLIASSSREHQEMRMITARLRGLAPEDPEFDGGFMELMRLVMHHVADEETRLLPQAERRIPEQLTELGFRMTKRRFQLMKPHAGEMIANTARAMPAATMVGGAGLLLATAWAFRLARRRWA